MTERLQGVQDPLERIAMFGAELSSGQLTLDGALGSLAVGAMTIPGFSARHVHQEVLQLEEADRDQVVAPGGSTYESLVKLTTRGLIFAEFSDDPARAPTGIPVEGVVESLVKASNEGVTWTDPVEELKRQQIIKRNAELLTSFARGLTSEDTPTSQVKGLMRAEFKDVLDLMSSRPSYGAINATRVILQIRKKAGLGNIQTSLSWIRHIRETVRKFGVNIYRLNN